MASPLRGSLPKIFAVISTPLITTRALGLSPRMVEEVSTVPWSSIKNPVPARTKPLSPERTCTTAGFTLSNSALASSPLS